MSTLFAQHRALIGASVRVECTDLTHLCGALYCIDPESGAVVLLRARDDDSDDRDEQDDWRVQIVMGHSVRAIERDEQATANESLEGIREHVLATTAAAQSELDSEALHQRREQLCRLLQKSFVPCVDEGDAGIAVFGGAARVRAPFRATHIESANEQILARLQQLVAQLDA